MIVKCDSCINQISINETREIYCKKEHWSGLGIGSELYEGNQYNTEWDDCDDFEPCTIAKFEF